MSDEITVVAGLYASKGGVREVLHPESLLFDMTNTQMVKNTVVTSAGGAALDLGSLDADKIGWFMARNLSSTSGEYIDIGISGTLIARLNPGEPCLFRLVPSTAIFAQAASGKTPLLEYMIVET